MIRPVVRARAIVAKTRTLTSPGYASSCSTYHLPDPLELLSGRLSKWQED